MAQNQVPWVRFVVTVFSYIVALLTQTGPHDLVSGTLDSGLGMRLWKTAYEYITTAWYVYETESHWTACRQLCYAVSVHLMYWQTALVSTL